VPVPGAGGLGATDPSFAGSGGPGDAPGELPPDQDVTPPPDPSALIGEPETITVTDGDREISVTSPDGQGHVTVTVDDGTGEPKTYQLDFGTGLPATAVPLPGQQPGMNPPLAGSDGFGAGQPGTGTQFFERIADQPVDAAGSAIRAGQDGTCTVKDGPLTITAERPPTMPETLRMTVDGGTGTPTTYTLDFSDPAHPVQVTTAQGQFVTGNNAGGFIDPVDGGPAGSAGAPRPEYAGTPPNAGVPGEASLASAQAQPPGPAQPPGQSGAGGGSGLPMLGGLGAGSGAQDQERGPGHFGVAGDLFEGDESLGETGSTFRISGSLDDDGDFSVQYGRRPDGAR
jgi:hypothetical protein